MALCFPQAGAPGDARNLLSATVAEISVTTDGVRVFRWTTAGAGYSPRALERRVRRLACVPARRPLRRPSADLHGACEAVCLDLRRCGAGAGLADGSRLPVSVGPLHQPVKFWGIQPSYAFVEQPQTNGVAERFIARSRQIIHGRMQHRGAIRGFVEQYNAQWIVEKNGYLSPEARHVAHRDVTQARRMRQTCVQGTGCDTQVALLTIRASKIVRRFRHRTTLGPRHHAVVSRPRSAYPTTCHETKGTIRCPTQSTVLTPTWMALAT